MLKTGPFFLISKYQLIVKILILKDVVLKKNVFLQVLSGNSEF